MNTDFFDGLLRQLLLVRSQYLSARLHFCSGQIMAAYKLGVISCAQQDMLYRLLYNASDYSYLPFPVGPGSPRSVLGKDIAQVPASENPEPVPAPTSRHELLLLCLLVPHGSYGSRLLPVHTMRVMPPRVCVSGRWGLLGPTGLVLRETHARQPSAKVLVRCLRQRQANPFRADSRTVRIGGVMA